MVLYHPVYGLVWVLLGSVRTGKGWSAESQGRSGQVRIGQDSPLWSILILYSYVWFCLVFYGHVRSCVIDCGHVSSYIVLYGFC